MARKTFTPEEQAKLQELLNQRDKSKNIQQDKALKSEGHWCTNCGSYFLEYNERVCQICGFESLANKDNPEFILPEDQNLTMCRVESLQFSGRYAFTHLKIDITPEHLKSTLTYRMFKDPNPYEFYVFIRVYNSNLKVGNQINLDLSKYSYFTTNNHINIHYNQEHFTDDDLIEIKTNYKF